MRARIVFVFAFAIVPVLSACAGEETAVLPGLLIEGPFSARVRFASFQTIPEREEDVRVLAITQEKLVYSELPGDTPRIYTKPAKEVIWVRAKSDPDQKWKTIASKKIDGPKKLPAPIDIGRRKFTPLEERRHNYFNLARLQVIADSLANEGDEDGWALLKARIDSTAKYLKAKKLDQDFAETFEVFTSCTEQYMALRKEWKQKLAQHLVNRNDVIRRRNQLALDWRMRERNASAIVGTGYLFAVLLGDVELARESMRGQGMIATASANFSREQFEASRDLQTLDQFILDVRKSIQEKQQAQLKARADKMRELALALNLPNLDGGGDWASRLKKQRDPQALAVLAKGQAAWQKKIAGQSNPWLELDAKLYSVPRAPGHPRKSADELIKLAVECIAIAESVPPDNAYDGDRYEIVSKAAAIAALAADFEWGNTSWKDTYHPYAAFAVRLYEYADRLGVIDEGGLLREFRILAEALAGKGDKAFQLGLNLRDLRKGFPAYHYYMARLNACREGKSPDVIDHAIMTVGSGWINEVRKASEVKALFRKGPKYELEFNKRVAVQVNAILPANGNTCLLENTSVYELTNLKGKIVLVGFNGKREIPLDIRYFAPKEKLLVNVGIFRANAAYLSFVCAQGTVKNQLVSR